MTHRQTSLRPSQGGKFSKPVIPNVRPTDESDRYVRADPANPYSWVGAKVRPKSGAFSGGLKVATVESVESLSGSCELMVWLKETGTWATPDFFELVK